MNNPAKSSPKPPVLSEARVFVSHDLTGNVDHGKPKMQTLAACLLGLYYRSVLPTLLSESRSLVHRIRIVWKIQREMGSGLPTVPVTLEPFALRGPHKYRHAYIESMKQLEAEFPVLTIWDRLIAARMWSDGTRCSYRSFYNVQNPSTERSCVSPKPENSMPPQATQQDSKHDL